MAQDNLLKTAHSGFWFPIFADFFLDGEHFPLHNPFVEFLLGPLLRHRVVPMHAILFKSHHLVLVVLNPQVLVE